jgi:hypothetical protein
MMEKNGIPNTKEKLGAEGKKFPAEDGLMEKAIRKVTKPKPKSNHDK